MERWLNPTLSAKIEMSFDIVIFGEGTVRTHPLNCPEPERSEGEGAMPSGNRFCARGAPPPKADAPLEHALGGESHPLRLRSAEARKSGGELRQSYGVTKSASRFAKATFAINNFMHYVYSLKCKDGHYIGCADDLKDRLERHQKSQVPATLNRLPVKLKFYFAIDDKYKAFEFEKYLKSGSGRAFLKKHFI
jgi:predicted GIY-YIG superfamily endonuclease